MLETLPSSRFTTIYDSLPPDVQQALVEKHLIPLLNQVHKGRSKKILSHAARLRKRHSSIPVLDLKAKRMEINALLDELHRDAKRSFVKERSNKKGLLSETVYSLTDWLNDIWTTVYEHNVDFVHAHKCLLFVAGTLDHIGNGRTSCRCAFTNMFLNVTIKNKLGKHIKSFDINGAHNVEEVLHFIWRDLFLSMFATGNHRQISKIPDMLEDIEDLMGWRALQRLLYGGKKCQHECGIEEDEDDEDYLEGENDVYYETESGDGLDEDEDFYDLLPRQYAKHWSSRVSSQMWRLRDHVQTALMSVFEVSPSQALFSALLSISPDPETTEEEMMTHLDTIATSCSETFSAALDIYTFMEDADMTMTLLRTHSHLLRPRDAPSLQAAVTVMGKSGDYQARSLEIIEKELLDTARALRAALLVSFSQLDTLSNKEEIQQILKLRQGAAGRQDRIEAWVDAVSTPGTTTPNPMAFAAMMMGLPLVPGMDPSEDADPLGYLDLDPHDPDLEDLREEFRPSFKNRFEGWCSVAFIVSGGDMVLVKVFKKLIELMPFLRANDVVEEMVGRLADKPSRHHVCDGLDALVHFVKQQRKKASLAKAYQRRHKEAQTQVAVSEPPTPETVAGPSTSPATPGTVPALSGLPAYLHVPFGGPSRPGYGGMEDVD